MSWGLEDSGYGKRADINEVPDDGSWLKYSILMNKEELKTLKTIVKGYMRNNHTTKSEKKLIERILNRNK